MNRAPYLLLSGLLLISGETMAIEEPSYTVLSQVEDFELRRYDEQLVAQTWVSGDQDTASRQGFKILADYIFGNNTAPSGESSKISMTAPVTMQSDNLNGQASQKIAMTAPVSMQQNNGKWRVPQCLVNIRCRHCQSRTIQTSKLYKCQLRHTV